MDSILQQSNARSAAARLHKAALEALPGHVPRQRSGCIEMHCLGHPCGVVRRTETAILPRRISGPTRKCLATWGSKSSSNTETAMEGVFTCGAIDTMLESCEKTMWCTLKMTQPIRPSIPMMMQDSEGQFLRNMTIHSY